MASDHRPLTTDGASWRPTATPEKLKARAEILSQIRRFFAERNVLEVETPLLSDAATSEVHLESLSVNLPDAGKGYLHTSPEYAMKRLLAADVGDCYQICKVFRAGESGSRHNPEFTMLEWYRLGFEWRDLAEEVAALLMQFLGERPVRYVSYAELFAEQGGDLASISVEELQQSLVKRGAAVPEIVMDRDAWLDLWMGEVVGPSLGQGEITVVHDYPASQASLARLDPNQPEVAERFELYVDGLELANGFRECTDAAELQERFERWNQQRASEGLEQMPLDERFLAATGAGMPEASGVAMGIDRLVMLATGSESLEQVISFAGRV